MATETPTPVIPAFPHGVTVEKISGVYENHQLIYTDHIAYRANGSREIAQITQYPDGRILAVKSYRVRGSLDNAAWSGIVRTLGGSTEDYFRGSVFPKNPEEAP